MNTRDFINYADAHGWYVDTEWNGDIQIDTPQGLVIISDGRVIEGKWIYDLYEADVITFKATSPIDWVEIIFVCLLLIGLIILFF